MGLYRSEALKLCAKKIDEVDKTLQVLGSSTSFNSIYKRTIMDIMIVIIYLCIKSEFKRVNELLADINMLPVSSVISELFEHREADGSFSIERSLPVDSKKLFIVAPSLRQRQSQLQISSHKINKSRMLLRTIRQVHLELYRVSNNLSNMYGIQISLEMAMCVMIDIIVLYRLYAKYREKSRNMYEMIFEFIHTIFLCLQYSTKIFIINYICDKTTKEAERTNEIIHTFYGQNTDFEIQKEIEIFSLQMMQCRNVFSAYGLYNLNCKHICSCIGIITTYMVIMIQVTDSMIGE
ncbi:putative gustatory receptor 2a [Vespa crabro]|uniref:putative gustatory receptor 2a n=1 Tax=Vespa crabro TaxID=7445 RepID=UPI001F019565|nr:putative gustatory receptor 2a [Vespa crabro]